MKAGIDPGLAGTGDELDDDVLRLLKKAEQEIVALRRRNEVLEAKVGTMDLFRIALSARFPESGVGYAEDVAWAIAQRVSRHHVAEQMAAKAEAEHGHS